MIPLLGRTGPFLIYSYTIILGVGILAAIGLTGWLAKKEQVENWFDAVLVCLIFGMIGGRFGFVWANWDYFQAHTASIHKLWQGGYSYIGALFAGIFGLWLWWVWQKRHLRPAQQTPFSSYTDLLAPGFVMLSACGWLACWAEGCAYSLETTIGFFAADLPDEFGIFAVRYQTQMIGIIGSLLVFVFVLLTRTRWRTGQLFWIALALLSLLNMGISLLRGDPALMIEPYRLDSIVYGTIVLISASFMLYYQKPISRS